MSDPARQEPVLPPDLKPMLAQPAEGPLASQDYAYEVKWDGMRVLVGLDGERLSLRTRNNIEAAPRFPELAVLRQAVAPSRAILDGEIVRLVEGRPNFGALQYRIASSNPYDIARLARAEPAALILFDLLRVEDDWIVQRPWNERRARLESIVTPGEVIQLSPVFPDGRALWQTVGAMGLEGVMAKRRAGRYTPGKRTAAWLKIRTTRTLDVVVGGWTEGSGSRGALGALVLGLYDGDLLRDIGRAGSGFDQEGLEASLRMLEAAEIDACPFAGRPDTQGKPAHWVRPDLVCEVKFSGWSNDGRLRFPIFLRWRPDKAPRECLLAEAPGRAQPGDTPGASGRV